MWGHLPILGVTVCVMIKRWRLARNDDLGTELRTLLGFSFVLPGWDISGAFSEAHLELKALGFCFGELSYDI